MSAPSQRPDAREREAARFALQGALDRAVLAGAPGAILALEAPTLEFEFAGASGRFRLDDARPLHPGDAFRAASVTKALTATCATELAGEGRWSLEDPIARYLEPELARDLAALENLARVEELTIRRLLGHTSGLPDYFFDRRFRARVAADPSRTWRPRELALAALERGRLDFPPGSDFAYGDTGYVLVGLALERLLGMPLADVLRARLYVRLGMEATYLEWREPPRGPELSHHYDGEEDLRAANLSFDWAGGGLVTTAADLLRFLRGVLGGGARTARTRGELCAWRDDLRFAPDATARYLRYGLGLGVIEVAGVELVGATGMWGAFAFFMPDSEVALAGTVNRRGFDRSHLLAEVVQVLGALSGGAGVRLREANETRGRGSR